MRLPSRFPRILPALVVLAMAGAAGLAKAPAAAAAEVPPAGQAFAIQTNGPNAALGLGDWYTSTATGAGSGYHYIEFSVGCAWPSSLPINVDLFSAPMNTDAGVIAAHEEPNGSLDNTEFELYGPGASIGPGFDKPAPGAGISGTRVTFAPEPAGVAESWARYATLAAPVVCGRYVLRAATSNDDQNGWRVRVGSDNDNDPANAPPATTDNPDGVAGTGDELIVGVDQVSYQQDSGANACLDLFEFVPAGQASVTFHNFDYDGASIPGATVTYTSPSGVATAGTISNPSATWNGSNTVARGGDVLANPEAGWWKLQSCIPSHNQFIQEGQLGVPAYFAQPPTPRLTIAKGDGATQVAPGQTLTYDVTVTNASNVDAVPGAATSVAISDALPANAAFVSCAWVAPATGSCGLGSPGTASGALTGVLPAGGVAHLQVVVTVDAAATGTVVNAATASYDDAFGQVFPTVTAMDTDAVTLTDLSLAMSHTGTFLVGAQGTYSVAVSNVGPVQTAGAVSVSDTLPSGLTFASGSGGGFTCTAAGQTVTCTRPASPALASGSTATIAIVVNVGPAALPSVTNTATVSMPGDTNAANDSASDLTAVSAVTIGDRVFDDPNGNGVQDSGETGIGSVGVTLYAADGTTVLATTSTSSTGAYSFTGLPGGSYVVAFDRPAGKVFTTSSRFTVTIPAGATDLNVDAGLVTASSIGGTVFDDTNGNGTRDAGESGLATVTVALQQGGATLLTTTTDTGGAYSFADLLAGSYDVVVVPPPGGFQLTTAANPAPLTVAIAENRTGLDFGFRDQHPVAGADTVQVTAGVPTTIDLGANDSPGDTPATWTITTAPAHGTLTCVASTCSYTADPAFAGSDLFTYTLTDADGDTAMGTGRVTVLAAPAPSTSSTTGGSTPTSPAATPSGTSSTTSAATASALGRSLTSSPALAVTGADAAREAALGLWLIVLGLVLALVGVTRSGPALPPRSARRRLAS